MQCGQNVQLLNVKLLVHHVNLKGFKMLIKVIPQQTVLSKCITNLTAG